MAVAKNSELSESLEDYLEVIWDLEKTNKVARAKDIADKMHVQSATVTGALKNLTEKGFINYEPYHFITLTPKGTKIAKEITRKHDVLKDFLFRVLQLDSDKAEETACRMEHTIDKSSIDKLLKFIEFIDNCPRTGEDWVQSFMNYCATDNLDSVDCDSCLKTCVDAYRRQNS
jgi:DtxR family Mn-dependent transcriptional regulator